MSPQASLLSVDTNGVRSSVKALGMYPQASLLSVDTHGVRSSVKALGMYPQSSILLVDTYGVLSCVKAVGFKPEFYLHLMLPTLPRTYSTVSGVGSKQNHSQTECKHNSKRTTY